MAVPASVQLQLTALNVAMNQLIRDRERIQAVFEDDLGNSLWNLLSAGEKTGFKNAVIADMNAAQDQIDAVITALAGL